ncbi:hypothetical protein EB796_018884 [Bugula neritina]|uniref:Tyrosine-protein kinase receptor n=1 Tax=Bugula neritina TaxID=10212 RepID=A0A7J7J9V7_BUGNE|nr:hypothetical protein EB796_018884 [Bugula neritina]
MEIVFDDNSFLTEFTRNYTYLPNPAVETVSRYGSILSGGLLMTFTGRNLESAHFYKLELYFGIETLAVDTECFKEIVGHYTQVVCVTPNVAAEYTRFVHKSNSSDQDTFLLTASLLGDGAPALVSGVERFNYTVSTSLPYFIRVKTAISYDVRQEEPINFIGKHLKQSLHPSDYQISFVTDLSTSQSSAIQCIVAELTDTLLTCLPEKLKLLQTFNESGAVTVEAQIKVGNLIYEDVTRLNLHNSDDTSTNPKPPSNYWVIALAVVLALLAVIAMIVVFLKFFECRKKSKPTEISSYTMDPVKDKYYKTVGEDLNEELKHKLNQMFIEPEMLSFNRSTDLLGKGAYGKVYLGQLQCQGNTLKSVAVKTLKESVDANSEQIEAFLEEATFLQLHEHANILVTLGVVWRSGEKPLVVLPYMANGDLCSLIRRPEITFSNGDLMHFGMQISAGMEYLITQHCLHRDLAARNCLVDNFYIVKIADFGMSKDVYRESYYREKDQDKPRPVKWMALESLREGVSNSATEVWAFGVVMWELLTRGNVPYPGISNSEMLNHLQSGHRLHKPTYTCPKVFDVIKECWNEDPLERPSFSQLKEFLEHSLSILDEPPLQKLGGRMVIYQPISYLY